MSKFFKIIPDTEVSDGINIIEMSDEQILIELKESDYFEAANEENIAQLFNSDKMSLDIERDEYKYNALIEKDKIDWMKEKVIAAFIGANSEEQPTYLRFNGTPITFTQSDSNKLLKIHIHKDIYFYSRFDQNDLIALYMN